MSSLLRIVSLATAAAVTASCQSLPRDGPSNRAIMSQANAPNATYAVFDLDYASAALIKSVPTQLGSLVLAESTARIDLIQVGDALAVTVFEPGGSLFAAGGASAGKEDENEPAMLPPLQVDADGYVSLPYAGRVRVAGSTATEASASIRRALAGKAISPQVIVTLAGSGANAINVVGAVGSPGRQPVVVGANRLIDVISAAGGPEGIPENLQVVVSRGEMRASAPLTQVLSDSRENIQLARGDQVYLMTTPRRFSSFGALGRITLNEMPTGEYTLTNALSSVGGLDDSSANARGAMVFRFERPEVARALGVAGPITSRGVPMIYRLDLTRADGYFIANDFIVQPNDVVYVPRATSAELRKFFEFVQTITRVIYDVTVTGALNTN